jgi:hypothetical protein
MNENSLGRWNLTRLLPTDQSDSPTWRVRFVALTSCALCGTGLLAGRLATRHGVPEGRRLREAKVLDTDKLKFGVPVQDALLRFWIQVRVAPIISPLAVMASLAVVWRPRTRAAHLASNIAFPQERANA